MGLSEEAKSRAKKQVRSFKLGPNLAIPNEVVRDKYPECATFLAV